MTRTYEPLSADEIDWMRKYVNRNPETSVGRVWGRFLGTLDAVVAAERKRCSAVASRVREELEEQARQEDDEGESELCEVDECRAGTAGYISAEIMKGDPAEWSWKRHRSGFINQRDSSRDSGWL
jgi:hypothetical protein